MTSSTSSRTLWASGYGGQIYTLSFTSSSSLPQSKRLSITSQTPCGIAPTWIQKHPTLPFLYACDEFAPDEGVISRFSISEAGGLSLVDSVKSGGEGPVHLVFSKDLKNLFVANYAGAVMARISLNSDGSFKNGGKGPEQVFKYEGKGPDLDRQEAPHPHGVFLDPTGEYLFCVDLGTDRVHLHILGENGVLIEMEGIKVEAGNGPRHLTFGKTSSGTTILYLVNELSNTVSLYLVDYSSPSSPKFTLLQSGISVLPAAYAKELGFTAAAISLLPSSSAPSHLVISNRSPDTLSPLPSSDSITIFKIDSKDGTLRTPHEELSVGGRGLRHLAVDEEGRYMAVGCQKTNEVVILECKGDGEEWEEVTRVGGIKDVTVVVWA